MANDSFVYEEFPFLLGSFGTEGDTNAPIGYIDGCIRLRDRDDITVNFGIRKKDITSKIRWYNAEGWLPCFVSEFETDRFSVKIESFADKVAMDNMDFELTYSRMTVTNNTDFLQLLPRVSEELIPVNREAQTKVSVEPRQTVVREYAITSSRYGHPEHGYRPISTIKLCGGFYVHYIIMKRYWEKRISKIIDIKKLPDMRLADAYRAGYIYTMIIKCGLELHVGEIAYNSAVDHDYIGILTTLFMLGDYKYAADYLRLMPTSGYYPDAAYKYAWPFAIYLLKTGDKETVLSHFEQIKLNAHNIGSSRCENGLMCASDAIDTNGFWTVDNQAALTGLCAYAFICDTLGYCDEAAWARKLYGELLDSVNSAMTELGVDFIPISPVQLNDDGMRGDPRDANKGAAFLFGRWSWDAYLLGGAQYGFMLDKIDATYTECFRQIAPFVDNIYNFGGYTHGYYSGGYNAGYGSAALRGEKYRDWGIKAYQFMIDSTMSCPYGWWEGIDYPSGDAIWDKPCSDKGGGSCQHMWGQAMLTKVLLDSLVCETSSKTLIIGRGIPDEWIYDGSVIEIDNIPVSDGRRTGFKIEVKNNDVILTFTEPLCEAASFEIPLFRNNIKNTDGYYYGLSSGRVAVPAESTTVTVTLGSVYVNKATATEKPKVAVKHTDNTSKFSICKGVLIGAGFAGAVAAVTALLLRGRKK